MLGGGPDGLVEAGRPTGRPRRGEPGLPELVAEPADQRLELLPRVGRGGEGDLVAQRRGRPEDEGGELALPEVRLDPAQLLQQAVLGSNTRIVEAGGDRVRFLDLAVLIL